MWGQKGGTTGEIPTHFFPFCIRAVEARKMRDNYTAIKDWGAAAV